MEYGAEDAALAASSPCYLTSRFRPFVRPARLKEPGTAVSGDFVSAHESAHLQRRGPGPTRMTNDDRGSFIRGGTGHQGATVGWRGSSRYASPPGGALGAAKTPTLATLIFSHRRMTTSTRDETRDGTSGLQRGRGDGTQAWDANRSV